jgi:chromate transport protein ChrA
MSDLSPEKPKYSGTFTEVLAVFFRLGLTCFGGPIAHLGYFQEEFVVRRKWLDEKTYADLVALLPILARSSVEPGVILDRAVACALSRRARGMDRFYVAVRRTRRSAGAGRYFFAGAAFAYWPPAG